MPRAALERIRLLSENIRYHEYAVSLEVEGALPVEDAARCVRFGASRLVVGMDEVRQLGEPAAPGALQKYTEQVTAAGDAFTAALGVAWNIHDMASTLRFANAAGGLAVTRAGAQPSLPDGDAVHALVRHGGN